MKKKGFTIIELLIVVALIGILVGVGGVSIRRQSESRAMLRVRNEIGDFFRVAAKRSQETGKKYGVDFDLSGKRIEVYREEDGNGKWIDGGTRRNIEKLELPNLFEYGIIWGSVFNQTFSSEIESSGRLDKSFTLYIFKASTGAGIGGGEELKHAVSFDSDDHIKYLHVREYIPVGTVTSKKIIDKGVSPSTNSDLKLIRD